MSIRQLNATYSPEEDRVILRVTTSAGEEFRLWLTRACVAQVLVSGSRASLARLEKEHAPAQAKVIAEFQHEAVRQTTRFTTFEPAPNLPLGPQPLLVRKVTAGIDGDVHALQWLLQDQRLLTIRFTDQLLGKLRLLLETIADKAQWNLAHALADPHEGAGAPASAPGGPAGNPILH